MSTGGRIKHVDIPGVDRTLRFHLHTSRDRYISEGIAELGIWEALETEVVRRLVRPGEVFVDCGANLGWYSVLAATLGAEVVAFEPEPGNLALLHTNIHVNGLGSNVEVHPVAVGRSSGQVTLQLSDDNQGDHRIVAQPDGTTLDVPMVRIDDVVADRVPAVVKLDTQGSEVSIIRGGPRTFAPDRMGSTSVILEFWPYGLTTCGASAEELLGLLAVVVGSSHRCFEIHETTGRLKPVTLRELAELARDGDYSPSGEGHMNLLVVPHDLERLLADLIDARDAASTAPEPIDAQLRLLASSERSVHSQNGEDGIIATLVELTGAPHVFVEIGAGSGTECNSRLPRTQGWQVFAFDGDPEGSEWVRRAFLTADNVNEVLRGAGVRPPVGVLTIDIDGNDYWVLRALDPALLPDVLVTEYNATLGPVDPLTVPYRAQRRWDHSNYFGASLAAMASLAHWRGLELVYCDSTGVNAFFVRRELLERAGLVAVPIERAYRAPAYGAPGPLGNRTGHQPTSRRFVRVDNPRVADVSFAAATARPPWGWARRLRHWISTSDAWRLRHSWVEAHRRTWRGGGPTK
jgi:FkbM family methyltransferase